jgi:hypothetical protein
MCDYLHEQPCEPPEPLEDIIKIVTLQLTTFALEHIQEQLRGYKCLNHVNKLMRSGKKKAWWNMKLKQRGCHV